MAKVVFMGTPDFAVPTLRALIEHHEVIGVVTQPDRPAGRGRGVQMSLGGVFGLSASGIEGLELNILSLNFGIGPSGLKLPLIGRIGSPSFPAAVAEPATP